jgi:hypothetical protein
MAFPDAISRRQTNSRLNVSDTAHFVATPPAEVDLTLLGLLRGRVSVSAEPPVRSVVYPPLCGQSRSSIRSRRFAVLIGRFYGGGI